MIRKAARFTITILTNQIGSPMPINPPHTGSYFTCMWTVEVVILEHARAAMVVFYRPL